MRRGLQAAICVAVMLPLLAGCESAPRQRPVKAGPVDAGAGSVESARRELQGSWILSSLTVISSAGIKMTVPADARLVYDEFGNISMQGKVTGSTEIDPSVLNLSGRAVIDPVAHTLRFQAITAESNDEKRVDPALDAKHVRYYEIAGDVLTTTVKDAAGKTTATATWRRVQ